MNVQEPKLTIAMASTFTAEPVKESLDYWQRKTHLFSEIKFALYNQVFQELLNPNSLFANNQNGVNVILVRFEDWEREKNRLSLRVEADEKAALLKTASALTLPNHLEVAQLNQYETEYVYQETFVDQVYFKHGITFNEGDCVIDIGANIGLFTLFVQQQCKNATIYSFEPAPAVFHKLQINAKLYCNNARCFNYGLSDASKQATFTFFPFSSVLSGVATNADLDKEAILATIYNRLKGSVDVENENLKELANQLVEDRFKQEETYQVQLRSLSEVIEEHNLEKIDLLKIDAEKSELSILLGIKEEHWPRIKQIVMEVGGKGNLHEVEQISNVLKERGFSFVVDEYNILSGSGLYNIYATRPTATANRITEASPLSLDNIENKVRDLGKALKMASERTLTPYLVYICPPSPGDNTRPKRQNRYQPLEDLLETSLTGTKGVYLVKSSQLLTTYPVPDFYDSHADELGHVPYKPTFFSVLGTAIARQIFALRSNPYKVIVLDCDQTLWQGICGEDRVDELTISQPYQALQRFMLLQQAQGMLLCLCSKNNEEDVFKVFEQHPEMLLKREHLVSWRINWQSKSENLQSLSQELQLSLDSFIFIDDSPVECAEVRINCPAVLTLQLPQDLETIPRFLQHIWAFDHRQVTEEDKLRTSQYQQNINREQLRQESLTLEDFLKSLNLQVDISEMASHQIARVAQLTQRTNQFNATTIRRSENEIQAFCQTNGRTCLTVAVKDRFGDYGLVGVVLFAIKAATLEVDTFLMSCRVLGRGVEHQILAHLGKLAQRQKLTQISLPYQPTAKNQPILDFLNGVGQPYQEPLEEGYCFKFPTSVCEAMAYHAPSTYLQNVSTQQLATPAKISANSDLLNEIASQLYDVEQIHREITSQQRKSRKEQGSFYPANTEVEEKLVSLWSELLHLDTVSISDNFFKLGGTSILAVQLVSKLREVFGIKIPLNSLLIYPTLAGLASEIEKITKGEKSSIQMMVEEDQDLASENKTAALMAEIENFSEAELQAEIAATLAELNENR